MKELEIEDAIKEPVTKPAVHIYGRKAMCSNCWHSWVTNSKKETKITCPKCGSKTSNIFYRLKEDGSAMAERLRYRLGMCPVCEYIWMIRSISKYVVCPNCKKEGRILKRRRQIFEKVFSNMVFKDPEELKSRLHIRFPKSIHRIDKYIDYCVKQIKKVEP